MPVIADVALAAPDVADYWLGDGGAFPNNPQLPLVVYRGAVPEGDPDALEQVFQANQWPRGWRNGVFDFDHYHSNAHEVLGVYRGSARLRFGGQEGVVIDAQAGDVLVLPAGTAHKRLGASADFSVVGRYPAGQEDYDLCYGEADERPASDRRIAEVPLPAADPVYGAEGPLMDLWQQGRRG